MLSGPVAEEVSRLTRNFTTGVGGKSMCCKEHFDMGESVGMGREGFSDLGLFSKNNAK